MRILNALLCIVIVAVCSPYSHAQADTALAYFEPNAATGTSTAVVVGSAARAHTAQFLPLDNNGKLVGKGDPAAQIEKALDNVAGALAKSGSGLDRIIRLNVYLVDEKIIKNVQAVLAKRFSGRAKPAVTFVVGMLAHPDALVAMDAVGTTDKKVSAGKVECSSCPNLCYLGGSCHVAILPAGPVAYVSGQASPGTLAEATRKTLDGLEKTLEFLGLSKSSIVQLKAFMKPMSEVGVVQKELAAFFAGQPIPPVVFVEWKNGQPIEIELIAAADKADPQAVNYLTQPGAEPSPIYSRIAKLSSGKTIYISGLYGATPNDGAKQIHEIFAELERVLKNTGSDLSHLVKATYYCATDDASGKLNQIRPSYYDPKRPPAASKAMVRSTGIPNTGITIDMIAAAP